MEPILFRDRAAIVITSIVAAFWLLGVISGILSGEMRPSSLVVMLIPIAAVWAARRLAVAVAEDRVILQYVARRIEVPFAEVRWIQETRAVGGRVIWQIYSESGRHRLPFAIRGSSPVIGSDVEEVMSAIRSRAKVAGYDITRRSHDKRRRPHQDYR